MNTHRLYLCSLLCASCALAVGVLAQPRESAEARQHIDAARMAAGDDWMQAADFFCSTEEQVRALDVLPSATQDDVEGQRVDPVKVFDNLYFVGRRSVATWALVTSDGIVLIDSGYADDFDGTLIAGLQKVGLDPGRVEYALIAHEHGDHYGGARSLQDRFGTRVYMSQAAWNALQPGAGAQDSATLPERDAVMSDLEPLVFGDTQITPVAIPGHTAGSMGFIFPVKDGDRTYMAGLFGGSILSPQSRLTAATYQQYLSSIAHFADVTKEAGVTVELMNHPIMDGLFDKLAALKVREPNAAHPLVVGEDAFQRFLSVMSQCAQAQIARLQPSE